MPYHSFLYKLDTLLLKQKNLPVLDITGFFFRIRTQVTETKEFARTGYNGFLFPHSHSGDGIGATHLGLHLSTNTEKETRYIQYGQILLFQ